MKTIQSKPMRKIKMEVELQYHAEVMHGDDKESTDWFFNTVLKDGLILHSNEIGDEVGTIKIIKIL